jgi:hypothetical protein
MEAEFDRMGVRAERFPAIAHSIPALGSTLSHLAVLKLAREQKYPYVCIFEDDFEFLVTKEECREIIAKLPETFDVAMLSWYMVESAPYNETFGKVLKATTSSGYIVHERFYDRLIERLDEGSQLLEQRFTVEYGAVAKYIVDQYWGDLQPSATWLYSLRRVGKQRSGFSDLTGKMETYDY